MESIIFATWIKRKEKMKKVFVYAIAGALLVSSCGSYAGSGAYTGSVLGSVLGSAIGGLSDGPRGSDWGSILGMAGGAVVGAAIGSAADRAQEERIDRKRAEIRERIAQKQGSNYGYERQQGTRSSDYGYDQSYNYGDLGANESGYDPMNGGDDRIELSIGGADGQKAAPVYRGAPATGRLEIRNVRFLDDNQNQVLEGGEVSKIVFEVVNRTGQMLTDIRPNVAEITGMRQVFISPNARVEQLRPNQGIRYTAMVKAGERIRNGEVCFEVSAIQGNGAISSNVEKLIVPTRR